MTTFTLTITKTELTLNGIALDSKMRMGYSLNLNPEAARHTTVLLQKEFKTAKAAWAYATPELIDSLGVVYHSNGTIGSEYADYGISVVRSR